MVRVSGCSGFVQNIFWSKLFIQTAYMWKLQRIFSDKKVTKTVSENSFYYKGNQHDSLSTQEEKDLVRLETSVVYEQWGVLEEGLR